MKKLTFKNIIYISFIAFCLISLTSWVSLSIHFIFLESSTIDLKFILGRINISFIISFVFTAFYSLFLLFFVCFVSKINLNSQIKIPILIILFIVDALLSISFPLQGLGIYDSHSKDFVRSNFYMYDVASITLISIVFYKFLNWYIPLKLDNEETNIILKMKKLTLKNILVISFVANIIFIVAGSYNYFSLVKNEGLPSFDRIDYDMVIFSGFFLISIFFMPLEFIFKFIITKFRFYAFLTILILNSLLFLEAYMFAGTGYMYSTYESGTVLFVTILDSFPSIFFSSILFYFFLKYYLKPKKELPNE